eukprot:TRINITY_DN1567_c0_g2_i2.p1 TRINITY_DN1567_c0_g2~~TRINITY_DN1567_c0_g2_i2.p1  ORF type:complete len:195 (+),score=32.52 TRINITY_DN1567_c0_g2_i2:78-662(+)
MGDRSIFCGGIPPKADQVSLKDFFEREFGPVVECKLIMDKQTGRHKGYGFVTFQAAETAERVKQNSNLNFMGKLMNVGSAYRKQPDSRMSSSPFGNGGMGHQFPGVYSHQPYQQQQSPYASNYYYSQNYYQQQQQQMYPYGYSQPQHYPFQPQQYPQGTWQNTGNPYANQQTQHHQGYPQGYQQYNSAQKGNQQ